MGNYCCFTRKIGAAQADQDNDSTSYNVVVAKVDSVTSVAKAEKVVRFQVGPKAGNSSHNDNNNNSNVEDKGGAAPVRIRVVVTQKELKQLLESRNGSTKRSSLELLLRIMRSRQMRLRTSGGGDSAWRPALENIPEADENIIN